MRRSYLQGLFTGLRARLLAIVLLAVLPTFLLFVAYAGYENSLTESRERSAVQERLVTDAHLLREMISQSRATLVTFGITYAIQAQDWNLVQGNAERLQVEHPEYAVIAVADKNGRVRASSKVVDRGRSLADEPLFKRAVTSGKLTVSDYQVDPLTKRPGVSVSLPVYNAKGELVAVEYVAYESSELRKRLSDPSGASTVVLLDGNGTVLVRQPSIRGSEGKPIGASALKKAVGAKARGETIGRGLDGVTRQYYYEPVFTEGEGSHVLAVGFAAAELLSEARRAFALLLLAFGGISLAALISAWLFGTRSIYRPAVALQQAAERVAEGDLAARVVVGDRNDEIGSLGNRFNEMAGTLQQHVEELNAAQRELSELNADLEVRVRRRTAELEVSNKELEAFSYSVSHDLRSPLRAIDGFSLALIEDYSDVLDDQGRDDLRRVRENASRMGNLIDSLLKLSRLSRQEMELRDVDLSALAQEVAQFLTESEPERVVEVRIEPGVHGIGDVALLRIVLENLMDNAWKFTGKLPSAVVEFGSLESEGEHVYFVRDNGAGFDMAYSSKLFGAFQRVHGQAEFPGIGIGLATTARIVRRHGGRIWAEGEPDKGATFYFTLE
jgi:signal transduction histidine kinase